MDSSRRPRRYLTAEEILELMNQADSDLSSLSDDDEDYQDNVELNDDDDDDDISILDLISSSNPGKNGEFILMHSQPLHLISARNRVLITAAQNQLSIFWNT
ncbi:hypothetical protein AVEN_34383-1 [Araneus ventricosus]|uniref:Uncharacterized protein n=1 Tax=Araneus ventricosus TaxID=182803 RepID=A0A4Y2G499_ARAVE|nr:hypothetical protein AVEN_34383-1 [Araneus ventricosus]